MDVQVAFEELVLRQQQLNQEQKQQQQDDEDGVVTGVIVTGENDVMNEHEIKEEAVIAVKKEEESTSDSERNNNEIAKASKVASEVAATDSIDDDDDKDDAANAIDAESSIPMAKEELANSATESGKAQEGDQSNDEKLTDAKTSGNDKEEIEETLAGTSESAGLKPSNTHRPSIPESFLRFLLLVAKMPIVIEDDEKMKSASPMTTIHKSPSSPRTSETIPEAARIAAKRAYDIFTLAQTTYESISEKQERSVQDQMTSDATASFFAACAGEFESCTGEGSSSTTSNNVNKRKGTNNETNNVMDGKILPKEQPSPAPSLQQMRGGMSTSSTTAAAAVASASAVFSNVMSKVTKKQSSLSEIGKKLMSGSGALTPRGDQAGGMEVGGIYPQKNNQGNSDDSAPSSLEDYEVIIDQEMLGLTVENVLERTIIRTLLPEGAAKRAGAKIGSLIAKVGNIDTSNLTHFETIDELRQSQRPLKLTLRHIGSDVLRCAREEMGRLIRGRGEEMASAGESTNRPWRGNVNSNQTSQESFDSILRQRWPSKSNASVSSAYDNGVPLVMTRAQNLHQAGKDLIRILALLVVGIEKELSNLPENVSASQEEDKTKHLTNKELNEAIEITSKILLDYARGHPDADKKPIDGTASESSKTYAPASSSFYPVPPGRVQGKMHGGKGPPGGRGSNTSKGKKGTNASPLLRIGDALQRTRSFLVESSSVTATRLRWEIIDYLCGVLDLDTEQELSEKEAASSTGGGEASPINDLGSAGSILKLIVLNCSTSEDFSIDLDDLSDNDSLSTLDQSMRSGRNSNTGNCFLSVVHRLAASKSVSARVSACSLGPILWSHLDFPRQLQLRGVITRALHDVEVIVRKSTAAVLHEIAELAFDRRAVPWLVLMCERSMTDPEPQLRAAAMTLTWHLAEHLPNAFVGDASKGSLSIKRLPSRTDPTFMDVYLLQCKLLPVASNLAEDRIASVRLSVAAQCDRLCNALGEHWFSIIIDLLQALLSDRDDRVRSEAILCMPRLVESVIEGASADRNVAVLESLLPQALKIQKDSSVMVRSSLATATGELLVFLVSLGGAGSLSPPPSPGKGNTEVEEVGGYKYYKKHVDETLIPLLQKLLQDSDPDVLSASLRAVTNASRSGARDRSGISACSHRIEIDDDLVSLASHQSHTSFDITKPVFIPVLSEDQVLRLLPTLSNLATSAQWRVRQSAVEIVPALLGCTYRHETRHEISKLCINLMSDKVDTVRRTAAECLCLGGSSLARHGEDDGGEWITKIVIPHLQTCSQSEDSKQRLLSLKMIEIIITNGLCPTQVMDHASPSSADDTSISAESPVRMILEIAASHASDRVANVRLNVGRMFGVVFFLLDRSDVDFVVDVLEKQLEKETNEDCGGDRDVVYFAQQALSLPRSFRRMESI